MRGGGVAAAIPASTRRSTRNTGRSPSTVRRTSRTYAGKPIGSARLVDGERLAGHHGHDLVDGEPERAVLDRHDHDDVAELVLVVHGAQVDHGERVAAQLEEPGDGGTYAGQRLDAHRADDLADLVERGREDTRAHAERQVAAHAPLLRDRHLRPRGGWTVDRPLKVVGKPTAQLNQLTRPGRHRAGGALRLDRSVLETIGGGPVRPRGARAGHRCARASPRAGTRRRPACWSR